MKNISVYIKNGEKTTFTLEKPIATNGDFITVREVTVFWNFENITSTIGNNTFDRTVNGSGTKETKTINDGYYDFEQLKERLENDKLELQMNNYNNTCIVNNKSQYSVDMKKLGVLLGFPENQQLTSGSHASPKAVDVNHGLRYLAITCDLVDKSKNIGVDGKESDVLAFLPVTPGTRLNSNCYIYERGDASRVANNTVVSEMVFTVKSNISAKVDVNVLLNISLGL